ncbi:probable mitochondrial import inner membrane translocase subunit TIM21 [Diospyros lotus]|uniref:probable mitochondrial import inner membrane translocase subunit TIM21 n=1 Tax=Diospyros lotus TaxID=55363 RepID=UPI00225AE801|nr:probable mitochondrial import inner membrane translocase subunit TIM21 [Diospyros lotus]
MHYVKRTGFSLKNRWANAVKSYRGSCSQMEHNPRKWLADAGSVGFSSARNDFVNGVVPKSGFASSSNVHGFITKEVLRAAGTSFPFMGQQTSESMVHFRSLENYGANIKGPCFARTFASTASEQERRDSSKTRKDISKVEDPFDAPTYNIPEKPVTFTEGASYSIIILAGLGIAAVAAYGVFKELIFEPKEYKIFGKALERIQNDSQVRVRIGSPVTGYGQESRNRAARQRIPNRVWTDEDGVEHVEVNFYIRGPHGGGKVYTEMFRDKVDKQWKFTYLIVEIKSPSPAQLMLESYVPA